MPAKRSRAFQCYRWLPLDFAGMDWASPPAPTGSARVQKNCANSGGLQPSATKLPASRTKTLHLSADTVQEQLKKCLNQKKIHKNQ